MGTAKAQKPWKTVSAKWLRTHFPTTPGMPLPDYVMVNMFVDRILYEAEAITNRSDARHRAAHPDWPLDTIDHRYISAWGFMHSQLSQMAREVPGVIQWMHANTPPRPMFADDFPAESPSPQSEAKPSAGKDALDTPNPKKGG